MVNTVNTKQWFIRFKRTLKLKMWTYCSYFLKKTPINFGKEEGVCPRAYYTMDSAFGVTTINVLFFRRVMLSFPLRKIRQHFAVPVATEDTSTEEVAYCDGSRLCQSAGKWFTSRFMFQESNALTAVLFGRLSLDLPIHAGHIPKSSNDMLWNYHAT